MTHHTIYTMLRDLGEEALLSYWEGLSSPLREELKGDIEGIDVSMLLAQRALLRGRGDESATATAYSPPSNVVAAASGTYREEGRKVVQAGGVGCLMVAGGQGTRLGFSGPKGMFPISTVLGKTLFQLFAEKVRAASMMAAKSLPLAIMVSPEHATRVKAFFIEHDYFGLVPSDVSFFIQGTLPLLEDDGGLLLASSGAVARGPDGNGGALEAFYRSGIWDSWSGRGIQCVAFSQVDNPLADPFDPDLIGYWHKCGLEIAIRCIPRGDAEEKVGVLVERSPAHLEVIEYSELPREVRYATAPDGRLLYPYANISSFCFGMPFIEKMAQQHGGDMPLHLAHKPAACTHYGKRGVKAISQAWKFEKFIFETLPLSHQVGALWYPRELCFAPLKNANGMDSPETVREALQAADRRAFTAVSGIEPPQIPFELALEFHYPTEPLLEHWHHRPLPDGGGYIQAF